MPHRSSALALILALLTASAGAQAPSFAGVWVLDSTAAGGALAADAGGYRSVLTIMQLDTAVVVERRLVDRARRPVAEPERLSYRLDDRERTVAWTAPSGARGTASVRARRVADAPAIVLVTVRRMPVAPERTRTTQLLERLELAPGGRLKVTRTEFDGRRERRRVYWFSRG